MTDVLEQPTNQLLPGLIQRPPELGRIRLGEKTDRGAPKRLNTFRLTSASKATLEAAAALYGGKVRAWTGAPDEGMWELTTEASELDVLIPGSLAVISQSYEFWQGGTCERRCDGNVEAITGLNCLCEAEGLKGPERLCDIVTRLRVMLPRVPGLGVWRLDTSGYQAATTLPSTVTLLSRLTPGQWIPAVLRAEQRSKRERLANNKVETHRFVVPVLDLPGTTIGQVAQITQPDTVPALQLETGGERPAAPTARERAAARRAELEQTTAVTGEVLDQAACTVPSPRGEACHLPGGHAGDHAAGVKRWPSPQPVDSAAGAAPTTSTAPAGSSEAPHEAAVESMPSSTAALDSARQVFAGEVIDPDVQAGLDLLGDQPVRRRGAHI